MLGHAGGLMLSVRREIASDFRGSGAILVSMKAHFGHSKVRFSEPSGRATKLVSVMRIRHLPQRGHSSGERAGSCVEAMGASDPERRFARFQKNHAKS